MAKAKRAPTSELRAAHAQLRTARRALNAGRAALGAGLFTPIVDLVTRGFAPSLGKAMDKHSGVTAAEGRVRRANKAVKAARNERRGRSDLRDSMSSLGKAAKEGLSAGLLGPSPRPGASLGQSFKDGLAWGLTGQPPPSGQPSQNRSRAMSAYRKATGDRAPKDMSVAEMRRQTKAAKSVGSAPAKPDILAPYNKYADARVAQKNFRANVKAAAGLSNAQKLAVVQKHGLGGALAVAGAQPYRGPAMPTPLPTPMSQSPPVISRAMGHASKALGVAGVIVSAGRAYKDVKAEGGSTAKAVASAGFVTGAGTALMYLGGKLGAPVMAAYGAASGAYSDKEDRLRGAVKGAINAVDPTGIFNPKTGQWFGEGMGSQWAHSKFASSHPRGRAAAVGTSMVEAPAAAAPGDRSTYRFQKDKQAEQAKSDARSSDRSSMLHTGLAVVNYMTDSPGQGALNMGLSALHSLAASSSRAKAKTASTKGRVIGDLINRSRGKDMGSRAFGGFDRGNEPEQLSSGGRQSSDVDARSAKFSAANKRFTAMRQAAQETDPAKKRKGWSNAARIGAYNAKAARRGFDPANMPYGGDANAGPEQGRAMGPR